MGEVSRYDVIYRCFCIFHLAVNVFLWLPLYAAGNVQYTAELGQRRSTAVAQLRLPWSSCGIICRCCLCNWSITRHDAVTQAVQVTVVSAWSTTALRCYQWLLCHPVYRQCLHSVRCNTVDSAFTVICTKYIGSVENVRNYNCSTATSRQLVTMCQCRHVTRLTGGVSSQKMTSHLQLCTTATVTRLTGGVSSQKTTSHLQRALSNCCQSVPGRRHRRRRQGNCLAGCWCDPAVTTLVSQQSMLVSIIQRHRPSWHHLCTESYDFWPSGPILSLRTVSSDVIRWWQVIWQ